MRKRASIGLVAVALGVQLLPAKTAPAVPAPRARFNHQGFVSPTTDLSVLTYNVKGLPWPVAFGRDDAFELIEQRLLNLRRGVTHPRIVVFQEAFTDRAKRIGINSGYAFSAYGPPISQSPVRGPNDANKFLSEATIFKGETAQKWLDSGLAVFSDYPILRVKRVAFPASACAGFDCLANKGALLVELQVPGQKLPVTLITTHLNSKRGARVSQTRSLQAYKRQVAILANFVRDNHRSETSLILAGDFNASSPARRTALAQASFLAGKKVNSTARHSGLDVLRATTVLDRKSVAEATYISLRGRDWQFFVNGTSAEIKPILLKIPFGREKDGTTFSDHFGFSIAYRINDAS